MSNESNFTERMKAYKDKNNFDVSASNSKTSM